MADQVIDVEYKLKKKDNNGLVYSFYWKLGFIFANLFKALHISPNMVSVFSFLFFVLSGFCLYQGEAFYVLSGVSFFLAILMDCTDGKLARMIGKTSQLGTWLDYNFDYLKPICVYAPLSLALYGKSSNILYLILGFTLIQVTLIYTIITMKWGQFDFSKGVKESYTKKSMWHSVLKQFYFYEGIEPLLFIGCAVARRLDLFLILWTLGMTIMYLLAAFVLGLQIAKNDRAALREK